MRRWIFALIAAAGLGVAPVRAQDAFELRDGDRVLFIGDTFFEREVDYGWIETRLTERFADRAVTFRNLGWAADTPMGRARASFDWNKSPGEWLVRVKEQLALVKPTVAFLSYGTTAVLDGDASIEALRGELPKLMDAIQEVSGGPVRFVLFGPAPRGSGFLTPGEIVGREAALNKANDVIRDVASARKAGFVDLLGPTLVPGEMRDGVHWTDAGYRQASAVIVERLGLGSAPSGKSNAGEELLNRAIRKKNELFFHRWRPSNWTYLFGFRKHEQGQNSVEIPRFDPLIAGWDARLRGLAHADAQDANTVAEARRLLEADNAPTPVKAQSPQPVPTFEVADGFEVTLWAENPQLHKPIEMNWDARGRLWVASSEVYPMIQPGQPASDSIVVLEDTRHTGKADKSTVFAGGLLIPTGVLPDDEGGCYVAASSQLLHIADTDGDGRGDRRRIILSSFGTEDTHHNLHTLRWGYDGRMYLNQSIYTHTHIETPHGVARLNSAGIWRYDPVDEHIEILSKGGCNPWGHHWDDYGDEFFTDGAGGKGVYHIMPGGTYFTYSDMRREGDSISPGNYPKFASLEVVESPNFPPDWQGNVITCDFRAHRVVRFAVDETGSSFRTREMPDLLRSTNVTFRPIDVRFGPDGALYVADWSNPIIQHGEVDFRDPRRDKEHGRIWRVAAKARPPAPVQDMARKGLDLDATLSHNGWEQASARRIAAIKLGAMRPEQARRKVAAWAAASKNPKAALEAVWLCEAVRARDAALLDKIAAFAPRPPAPSPTPSATRPSPPPRRSSFAFPPTPIRGCAWRRSAGSARSGRRPPSRPLSPPSSCPWTPRSITRSG
jgi:glucose/arabinose dehydrogenase